MSQKNVYNISQLLTMPKKLFNYQFVNLFLFQTKGCRYDNLLCKQIITIETYN